MLVVQIDKNLRLIFWLMTSIGDGQSLEDISHRFEIPRERAMEILNILVSTQLCTIQNGRYSMGSQSIHIARGSAHLYKHHTNWRLRAIEASDKISADEMMYTAPMSIAKKDFPKIRSRLAEVIKEVTTLAIDSKAEEMVYLGIDFIQIKK